MSTGWLIVTCLYFQVEVFRLSVDVSLETLSSLGHPITRTSLESASSPRTLLLS